MFICPGRYWGRSTQSKNHPLLSSKTSLPSHKTSFCKPLEKPVPKELILLCMCAVSSREQVLQSRPEICFASIGCEKLV